MGFSPGEFNDRNRLLHFEGKPGHVVLWTANELEVIMDLDANNARKCAEQLTLLADMLDGDAL